MHHVEAYYPPRKTRQALGFARKFQIKNSNSAVVHQNTIVPEN